jgi:hypothetical protein
MPKAMLSVEPRQASQVDDTSVAPLRRLGYHAALQGAIAISDHLSGVVDVLGKARREAWQGSQVVDPAGVPLDGLAVAEAYRLTRVVDACGNAKLSARLAARQDSQVDSAATAPLGGVFLGLRRAGGRADQADGGGKNC